MRALKTVLLPGLDGTGTLFEPFIAAAPSHRNIGPQPLPCDKPRDYRELTDWIRERLPPGPVVLIAESFSGPLALLLAAQCRDVVAVVLCATFVEPPLRLPFAPPAVVWKRAPPLPLARWLLTGGDRALAESVQRAMVTVPSDVIAQRIASVLRIDVRKELEAFTRPLLYLQATRDRVVGARSADLIRVIKPQAEFAQVDAPHLLLQANPSSAWSFVEPFLERVENAHAEGSRLR